MQQQQGKMQGLTSWKTMPRGRKQRLSSSEEFSRKEKEDRQHAGAMARRQKREIVVSKREEPSFWHRGVRGRKRGGIPRFAGPKKKKQKQEKGASSTEMRNNAYEPGPHRRWGKTGRGGKLDRGTLRGPGKKKKTIG